ncbi:hypothetical protein CC2G_001122 [Coprinopsis cinerea AmutBmut pab1-1]|nr:hypothetical protein CC2G_001122 [Coprinopsis cinerea AmutBmut pab1-1]
MESNAYPPLANVHVPVQSRVLSTSCCPDKDLVLLISRLGGLDRISLWNSNSGAKVWETDVGEEDATVNVNGIAWSPDGQTIACMLDPPRVSLHSIQDGRIVTRLPLQLPATKLRNQLEGIWWFCPPPKPVQNSIIPDIFKRNNIITGSAESILKNLPYLDPLPEDSDKLTATNLFAFQGSQTRSHSKSQLPEAINTWPTLSPDSKAAAVDSTIQHQSSIKPQGTLDEKDDSNLNSILMISDTLGNIYSFFDGAFPLGVVSLGREASFVTVEKSSRDFKFFGHAKFNSLSSPRILIAPTIVDMPLLANRNIRDLARLSSIVRDLTWYIMRVVREMKEAWFGNETSTGARELGPRWVAALEEKQKEQFGQDSADPILDLTWLLTTGRASEALADFLGSGEQMSDRGIQKWETVMSDALTKLRDYSEKRLAPALQRVHLVLEELQGWATMSRFSDFQLDSKEIADSIRAAGRGIVLATWLAAAVRREHFRFKEFIIWLRFESTNINAQNPTDNQTSRHDILEVNNYFVSGLTSSSIDLWFQGEVPQFRPRDLGVPEPQNDQLESVMERAAQVARSPPALEWQENIMQNDHRGVQRNLVALADHLATRCSRIFSLAAGAASRSASVHHHEPAIATTTEPKSNNQSGLVFRERIAQEANEFIENYLTIVKDHNVLVLVQSRYGDSGSDLSLRVAIVSLDCVLDQGRTLPATILAADYFDDESVVVVVRLNKDAWVSTFAYANLVYLEVPYRTGVTATLEDLVQSAINEWKAGNITSLPVLLTRRRVLSGCRHGEAELAVNGRRNRRVACVVDGVGNRLEAFDLGDEGEEVEEEE